MENKLVFLQCYIVKYCCWFHWRMLKSHWRVVLSKADAQKASPKVLLSKDQRVEATQRTSPHCWDSATGFYRELLIKGLKTETYKIVLHNPLYSNRVDCRDKHSLAGNGVFLKQSHWPCNVVVYGQLCAVMVGSPSVLLWSAHLVHCSPRSTWGASSQVRPTLDRMSAPRSLRWRTFHCHTVAPHSWPRPEKEAKGWGHDSLLTHKDKNRLCLYWKKTPSARN